MASGNPAKRASHRGFVDTERCQPQRRFAVTDAGASHSDPRQSQLADITGQGRDQSKLLGGVICRNPSIRRDSTAGEVSAKPVCMVRVIIPG